MKWLKYSHSNNEWTKADNMKNVETKSFRCILFRFFLRWFFFFDFNETSRNTNLNFLLFIYKNYLLFLLARMIARKDLLDQDLNLKLTRNDRLLDVFLLLFFFFSFFSFSSSSQRRARASSSTRVRDSRAKNFLRDASSSFENENRSWWKHASVFDRFW